MAGGAALGQRLTVKNTQVRKAIWAGALTQLFVVGLLFVTFIIAHIVPIDPVLSILGDRATDAQIAAERLRLGLDEPMWKQFGIYVWQALQGDFGVSIRTREPVIEEIARFKTKNGAAYKLARQIFSDSYLNSAQLIVKVAA